MTKLRNPSAGRPPRARGWDSSNPKWVGEESWGKHWSWERWAGSGVISNLTVGPDGCRDQAIHVRQQEEALTYCGRQSPMEGIPPGWEVLTRDSGSPWDLSIPKEHRPINIGTPFFTFSLWDSHWSKQVWSALPGACYFDSAGSCRGIFGLAPGRCQPLHNPHEMCNNYAQRHTINMTYPWRASLLLKVLLPEVCFSLSIGCRLCGIFWYQGRESSVGFALYIYGYYGVDFH